MKITAPFVLNQNPELTGDLELDIQPNLSAVITFESFDFSDIDHNLAIYGLEWGRYEIPRDTMIAFTGLNDCNSSLLLLLKNNVLEVKWSSEDQMLIKSYYIRKIHQDKMDANHRSLQDAVWTYCANPSEHNFINLIDASVAYRQGFNKS